MSKLVSVIMPVFNGLPFLNKAIESVLKQTYKNFEFIIIDDASTDDSWDLIKKYQTKDARIKAFRNPQKLGISKTLNISLQKVKANYISRMDADDIMERKRLEKQVNFLKANRDVVVLGSFMKEINENGEVIGQRQVPTNHNDIYQMMYYAMGIQHPSLMFNKSLIPKNFSWYQESDYISDLDILFRLFKYGKFSNLPEFLMHYRIHKQNLSLKHPKFTFKEAQRIRRKAVKDYGYQPNLKAKLLNFISSIVISLLPEKYVLSFYRLFRKLS